MGDYNSTATYNYNYNKSKSEYEYKAAYCCTDISYFYGVNEGSFTLKHSTHMFTHNDTVNKILILRQIYDPDKNPKNDNIPNSDTILETDQ